MTGFATFFVILLGLFAFGLVGISAPGIRYLAV
jgi:hypothetical protein